VNIDQFTRPKMASEKQLKYLAVLMDVPDEEIKPMTAKEAHDRIEAILEGREMEYKIEPAGPDEGDRFSIY